MLLHLWSSGSRHWSHLSPVKPGMQRHRPVVCSQSCLAAPRRSQSHAVHARQHRHATRWGLAFMSIMRRIGSHSGHGRRVTSSHTELDLTVLQFKMLFGAKELTRTETITKTKSATTNNTLHAGGSLKYKKNVLKVKVKGHQNPITFRIAHIPTKLIYLLTYLFSDIRAERPLTMCILL